MPYYTQFESFSIVFLQSITFFYNLKYIRDVLHAPYIRYDPSYILVVKVTIFITDINDLPAVNKVYRKCGYRVVEYETSYTAFSYDIEIYFI